MSNGTLRTKRPRPCAWARPAPLRCALIPRPCSLPALFMSVSPWRTRNRSCEEEEAAGEEQEDEEPRWPWRGPHPPAGEGPAAWC